MNCFDCALRMKGTYPAKWECRDGHHIDPPDGLPIEFMKMGCKSHWQDKPHPTDEEYEQLFAALETTPLHEHDRLFREFKFRFKIRDKIRTKPAKQLSLL